MKSVRERLTALLARIESHLSDPGDLVAMAQEFGASAFHFHRVFRKCVGQTPREYVERLRLERAFIRLSLTSENIREIGQAVGFAYHETFSRSFKRRFQIAPNQLRRTMQASLREEPQAKTPLADDGCRLSHVRFESLAPALLLSTRRMGDYADLDYAPFTRTDKLWNPLARWAARHDVPHTKVGWGLAYDFPGLTAPADQRFDACIRIERPVPSGMDMQCLAFAGGTYAIIEHIGPAATILSAYNSLVNEINIQSRRYAWREGPSLAVYQDVRIGGNPGFNHTTVCLPVKLVRMRKKRQGTARHAS